MCVDLHTPVYWCARFVSFLSLLVALAGIGGGTSLSSFPMGTIPHGIYNNNGHTSVGDGSIFIYPFVFRFLLHRHRRSFCFIIFLSFTFFPCFSSLSLILCFSIFLPVLRIYTHDFHPHDTPDLSFNVSLVRFLFSMRLLFLRSSLRRHTYDYIIRYIWC